MAPKPAKQTMPAAGAAARKEPSQQRSRERVERMLQAATTLIERQGGTNMRMSDVADQAGVSLASLYQFFPDKTAIIHTLAERCALESRACIAAELDTVASAKELLDAFSRLLDTYHALFRTRPVIRDIWSSTQADAGLRDMELAESRHNAAVLVDALMRIRPDADRQLLEAAAFLIWHLGEATMRLTVSVSEAEGDRLVETYKRMALAELRTLAGQ